MAQDPQNFSNYHGHLDHTFLCDSKPQIQPSVHLSRVSYPTLGLARYLLQEDSGRDARWSMAEDDGACGLRFVELQVEDP